MLLLVATPQSLASWHSDAQDIMGTRVSVTLWHPQEKNAKAAIGAVMTEMHRIDNTLSPYKPDSELYRVNASAAKGAVKISTELVALIDKALYYSRLSHGAFDISFASLGRYYDYRQKRQPSQAQKKTLLAAMDYRLIQLDRANETVSFAHPKLQIDLGGIAKGYAVDKAISILKERGVAHATVTAGGDSRALGDKRGRPWIIGIKNPRGEGRPAVVLPLINEAISTSGDYERYFIDEQAAKRVHHIIDPSTGESAGQITSVSILGPLGFDTDPLSTTVFVMGVKKGLQLINTLSGFEGVIIDSRGQVHYSEGLTPPKQAVEQ